MEHGVAVGVRIEQEGRPQRFIRATTAVVSGEPIIAATVMMANARSKALNIAPLAHVMQPVERTTPSVDCCRSRCFPSWNPPGSSMRVSTGLQRLGVGRRQDEEHKASDGLGFNVIKTGYSTIALYVGLKSDPKVNCAATQACAFLGKLETTAASSLPSTLPQEKWGLTGATLRLYSAFGHSDTPLYDPQTGDVGHVILCPTSLR